MKNMPDPRAVFPNEYHTSCFIKNVVQAPNIHIGDYTYYDDPMDPTGFERNNVLFNWPEFGDQLIIGKFCAIASGTQFIMGSANHRISSASTYPFAVFGGAWAEAVPPSGATAAERGYCGGQRRVDRAAMHHSARRAHRRWRHCGGLFRGIPGCGTLYHCGGQPGPAAEKAVRPRAHRPFAAAAVVGYGTGAAAGMAAPVV